MGLDTAAVVQVIGDQFSGSILIIFDQSVTTGPTSDLSQWTATGGAGGNPQTIMISLGRIILQSNLWGGPSFPSSIAYAYSGGPHYKTSAPGEVPDFSSPIPFP